MYHTIKHNTASGGGLSLMEVVTETKLHAFWERLERLAFSRAAWSKGYVEESRVGGGGGGGGREITEALKPAELCLTPTVCLLIRIQGPG